MLVRHPFVTQRTIGLIHWHALRLWRRGVRSTAIGEVRPRRTRADAAADRPPPGDDRESR